MEPSKNAICQAVKRLRPGITRNVLFEVMGLPHTYTTHNRYWAETYNILPWNERTETERQAALVKAQSMLDSI